MRRSGLEKAYIYLNKHAVLLVALPRQVSTRQKPLAENYLKRSDSIQGLPVK